MRAAFSRIAAVAFLLATVPVHADDVAVTQCGQTVYGKGHLAADLDCSTGVLQTIQLYGRLDLNGHTLTGPAQTFAIECPGKCKITGPGTITGTTGAGVLGRRTMVMEDVTLTGLDTAVKLKSDTGKGSGTFRRCTLTGNAAGIRSNMAVNLVDTTISGTTHSGAVVGIGFVENGVECTFRPLRLKRSSVTGTADGADCGTSHNCADLITCEKPPRLIDSTCGTSCQGESGIPCANWGVCDAE